MDVFRLAVPEWTDDFMVALKSIGKWSTGCGVRQTLARILLSA